MLRLFSIYGFPALWKCSYQGASCVTERKVLSLLPVSSTFRHRPLTLACHFSTGRPVWSDALQPKRDRSEEKEAMDLNKWKSIMRSQAASEEKQQVNDKEEASDADENLKEPEDDLKNSSSLQATRDLVAMWRQAGKRVPQEITDEEVQTLSGLTAKSSMKKYLKHLALRERHKEVRKEKKQKKKEEREASMNQNKAKDSNAEEGNDQRERELKNTFLLQFWNRSVDTQHAWRSAQAMVFGQPLVFDMSYESNMVRQEVENTVRQLVEAEGWNRRATDPFHLHFCNLQPKGAYMQQLLKRYGAEAWDNLLVTSTDHQHVDVFPREKLVYLTADSRNVLHTFDHSKVYIIGALVDRSIQSGLSLANAKRLNLATARLPLDEFLHWDMGTKNLTLDQMIRIMMTMKDTGKWEEALKFVPKRKHDGFHKDQTEKDITNKWVRGVTHHGPRVDNGRQLRSGERTFKNESQKLYRFHNQSGFTGRDRMTGLPSGRENQPATTRVQTSLKNTLAGRKGAGKSKIWWDDE
ncbi:tRNA methyltransferase 10 homolog C-like [Chelmon rostratus]|uniref:tRNA methyltransferase 10 homolog C-like n=1 Tax=Chelmon rostratus TaxID=109905 RepID=UPI001BE86E55|nr:tRNA methyltransferase 10 homolog C-like [Chelmon rostratus]